MAQCQSGLTVQHLERTKIPMWNNRYIIDGTKAGTFIQETPLLAQSNTENMVRGAGKIGIAAREVQLEDYKGDIPILMASRHVDDIANFVHGINPDPNITGYATGQDFNENNTPFFLLYHVLGSGANNGKVLYSSIGLNGFQWGFVPGNITQYVNFQDGTVNANAQMFKTLKKPLFFEGIGHAVEVTEQTTPDASAKVSSWLDGCCAVWFRRDDGTKYPERGFVKNFSTFPTHTAVAADSRIDALVLYRTGSGYQDQALLIVEGTESATPVAPLDSAIETAVDAVVSGASWCRLANITVDETTTVIINNADIEVPTYSSLTHFLTAIEHVERNSFFTDKYLFYYMTKEMLGGGTKFEDVTVTTTTTTPTASTKFLEVVYAVDSPYTFATPD